jgi:hypothetical protein
MWRFNQKIIALYADWESRNSWVLIQDPNFGWMRLRDDNFDAVQYMTTLAAEAKSDDRPVWFYEDPVGKISQLYVF